MLRESGEETGSEYDLRAVNGGHGDGGVTAGESLVAFAEAVLSGDAAGIATDGIKYATQMGYDVVMVDTAGRMQDNAPLMRSLSKLVTLNDPDVRARAPPLPWPLLSHRTRVPSLAADAPPIGSRRAHSSCSSWARR